MRTSDGDTTLFISASTACGNVVDLISDAPFASPDHSLTASSEISVWRASRRSRLSSTVYWRPSVNAIGEWIQVFKIFQDFLRFKVFHHVI